MKEQIQQKIERVIDDMIKPIGEPSGFSESATWSKGRKEALKDLRTKAPQLAQEIVELFEQENNPNHFRGCCGGSLRDCKCVCHKLKDNT